MRTFVAALYAAVTMIACSQRESPPAVAKPPATPAAGPPAPAPAPVAPKPDPSDLGDGTALAAPIRFKNLTLIPIVATGVTDDTDYLVLDEGMKRREVKIREQDDADVNELTLTNKSAQPLFVMTGEVVLGGKQDRIIGKNTVVPPHTTQAVPVFCVEHGRWTSRHADFASAGVLAHQTLRAKAAYESQSDVWDEVATKNAKRGLDRGNDTGTYRGTAAAQTTLADWDDAFDRGLAEAPRARQVGYAVALNGEVVAVDVFGGPALFAKLDRKLRRSYYAEAQDAPVTEGARAPSPADVKAFLHRADAAPEAKTYDTPEADTLDRIGDTSASTTVMSKGAVAKKVYRSTTKYEKKAKMVEPHGAAKIFEDDEMEQEPIAPRAR